MLPQFVFFLGTFSASIEAQARQAPVDSDCRFWPPGSRPSIASLRAVTSGTSVFYWWENVSGRCLPCSRCPADQVTIKGCNLLSDTICGSRSELKMLDVEGEDDEVYDNMYDPDPDEEAILHYEAPTEKEDDEEEVFGERRTEERQKDGNSPTRDILKYRMRERGDLRSLKKATMQGGLDVGDGLETHSDYGQPAFFEEEEDPGERNQVVDQAERPIVDVVRQFLTTNSTLSPVQRQGVARWIRRGKKSRDMTTRSKATTRTWLARATMTSSKESSQVRRGGKGTQGFQAEQALLPEVEGTSTRRVRSTTSDLGFDGIEHDDLDVDSTTQSAGDSAFRKIFHMLEEGGRKANSELEAVVKNTKGDKKNNLAILQYALAAVSGLALLLLAFLLVILLKKKLSSNFKLFDEQNVAENYQTMSSFPSRSNSATTTLPSSRLPSVSEESSVPKLHPAPKSPSSSSPSSPPPPPSTSSSSSSPPPAAVLRSLNNIRPTLVDQTGRTVVL